MFYLGYFLGVVTSGLLLSFPLYLVRGSLLAEAQAIQIPTFTRRTREKKKPKYISEEEQYAREQKRAPLDPGL